MNSIGNTPLIKLEQLVDKDSASIYVKYEGGNPTGSMKDRMALSMIEGAESRGQLKPGGRVVEYTGGSTGTSLAMVCAKKGYKAHFITSDAFSKEKLLSMQAFGAKLEIIPSINGKITAKLIDDMIARARELSLEPDTYWPDQINNEDNKKAYYKMAVEILNELGTDIDEFITGVGTGACFSGNAEVLKHHIPNIRCIAVEPLHVRFLSGGDSTGTHRLEGIGLGFIPPIYRKDLQDGVISVSDEDAYSTAKKLAVNEGIWGGITSGANVWAALQQAKKLGRGKRVVTVIIDTGLKYLHGDLYKNQ